jgi:hypothetical protein
MKISKSYVMAKFNAQEINLAETYKNHLIEEIERAYGSEIKNLKDGKVLIELIENNLSLLMSEIKLTEMDRNREKIKRMESIFTQMDNSADYKKG